MSELKATPGPWNICWTTYNGRPVNFSITASPYGSIRPIVETEWKTDWSEVEGKELEANAYLIAAAPALYALVEEMMDCLDENMVERHDSGGLAALGITHSDDECTLCKARKLLSAARGEEPKP